MWVEQMGETCKARFTRTVTLGLGFFNLPCNPRIDSIILNYL